MLLHISHISYGYPDAIDSLFEDVDVSFAQGWTGIVGPNGSGKSTLARIAARHIDPDEGFVSPKLLSAYCEQETEHPPEKLAEFASDYNKSAVRLRALLAIEDEWMWRFSTLSHGERKRIQIAVALWEEPDVLIVDEPTNHLDADIREVLITSLKSFKGIGIIISHDRFLLDTLVDHCIFVDNSTVITRPGGYTKGHEQAQLERETTIRERKHAKESLSKLQKEKTQRANMADKAKSRRSARHLDKKDSDGRAKIGLAIFTGQDGKRGKLSTQMDSRLEQAHKRLDQAQISKQYGGNVWLEASPSHRSALLMMEEDSIQLGENSTLSFPALTLGNQDHVGLTGKNGTGKSTLLRHLLKQLADDLSILYIKQELTETETHLALKALGKLSSKEAGMLLSIIAQLNSSPSAFLQGDRVSPGEMRKLLLAQGMLGNPDLIIMDEPTNHLDILSIEAMERVLSSCPCALILVSHDEVFIHNATSIRWHIEEKTSHENQLNISYA